MENKELQEQLQKMRLEAEERDAQRRANANGLKYLPKDQVFIDLDALALIPEKKAIEAQMAVIEAKDNKIVVIAYDPKFSKTKELLNELKEKGYDVVIYVVSETSLNHAFSYYRFISKDRKAIVGSVSIKKLPDEKAAKGLIKMLDTLTKVKEAILGYNDTAKISELLQVILMGAIKNRASDIHIEPTKGNAKIRYRIDGILNDIFVDLKPSVYKMIVSRIKLLSKLKLNVSDEPQDGRFTINLGTKEIETRVAVAPSEFGEVIVMRLLDPDSINLTLKDLGLRDDDLKIVMEELARPNGMILNTGPTGSGKTTTLYAFLRHKNSPEVKIITIEDPIEYHLKGIEQTQVDPEAGYTFASGLRSLMRQDPDIILVGEIRDKETAEIAVQAALTGHLLFSTVHANNAAAAIPRLLDLGVKPVSLAPALNMIIAQRLVRRLCNKCKQKIDIDEETKNKIVEYVNSLPDRVNKKEILNNMELYKPVGCEECGGTGYKGRIAVFELLRVTTSIQELIIKGAGQIEIEREIDKTDFVNMQEDGVIKVITGITTLDEVERVVGKTPLDISRSGNIEDNGKNKNQGANQEKDENITNDNNEMTQIAKNGE